MKIYMLTFSVLLLSACCCSPQKSTKQEKTENLGLQNGERKNSPKDTELNNLEAFSKGEMYLTETGLQKASQLEFEYDEQGRLLLSDRFWDTHWLPSANEDKSVFWGWSIIPVCTKKS